MTGLPNLNHPAFQEATEMLRAQGHAVYSPHERPWDNPRQAFTEYCRIICAADAIYMLPGWQKSKGAQIEHALAVYCGLDIMMDMSATPKPKRGRPKNVRNAD